MLRVAINGFGRIGRCVVRALFEKGYAEHIQLVAINDLADNTLLAHLTEYDSSHGRFPGEVRYADNKMHINGCVVAMLNESQPQQLPWQEMQIDIVLECSGHMRTRELAQQHINAGAKKVLISAPMDDADRTIVYGINHQLLTSSDTIVSNASCTTNCLAPVAKVIDDLLGIEQGMMTTVHAFTNDQHLLDQAPSDFYRARSAPRSVIPTTTGAAVAVALVLPNLKGKLDGMALRVPISNVSIVDLHCTVKKSISAAALNAAMAQAACEQFNGVLAYNEKPLVSIDFNHHSASSIFDANHSMVIGQQLKVMSWYDNEWGFSNRMLDTALVMHQADYQ